MPQWGRTDNAANSVIWAPAQLNKAPTRANANTLYGNTTSGGFITGATHAVVAVDDSETWGTPVASPGWHLKTTGSGGRSGRIQYETLVALTSVSGDGDAAVVPNYRLSFTTQPSSANVADEANATFTVVAKSQPSGATITYQWQVDTGSGFGNITDGGKYSNATTASLFINAANSTFDGYIYRAVISETNSTSNTSSSAVLTVS